MLAAALLTVISFHNLFVGTMLCFLVSAAPAGLLAISLAVSAAGSMVIVNTVVLVKARFGLGEIEVAWPASAPSDLTHDHPNLPADHPHLRTHADQGRHHHSLIVDDLHRIWPRG